MDERVRQIEAHIDQTRERLGENLEELEHRVDVATDWREQVRARPYVALSVAAAGGILLAAFLHRSTHRSPRRPFTSKGAPSRAVSPSGPHARRQSREFLEKVQGALVGLASARVRQYIGEFVPGFEEHYRRAEQRMNPTISTPPGMARP